MLLLEETILRLDSTTYHAAPTTDREIEIPTPRHAHIYGEVSPRNLSIKKLI